MSTHSQADRQIIRCREAGPADLPSSSTSLANHPITGSLTNQRQLTHSFMVIDAAGPPGILHDITELPRLDSTSRLSYLKYQEVRH